MPIVAGRPQIVLHRRQTDLGSGLVFLFRRKMARVLPLRIWVYLCQKLFLQRPTSSLPVIGAGRWCWLLEATLNHDDSGYTGLPLPSYSFLL